MSMEEGTVKLDELRILATINIYKFVAITVSNIKTELSTLCTYGSHT